MIELNLLPEEQRVKRSRLDLPEIPIIPIAVGIAAVLVVLQLFIWLSVRAKSAQVSRLKEKSEGLASQKAGLDKIKEELSYFEGRSGAIRDLYGKRLPWSEIMSGISNSIMPNIWLYELSCGTKDSRQSLFMEGYAAGSADDATVSVRDFIHNLEMNKTFSLYFMDAELEDITSSMFENREVMQFRLVCPFRIKEKE
ncbi:MAG: hypothetical protein ABH885_06055 [Candidatus Omnitrophota bacterium]